MKLRRMRIMSIEINKNGTGKELITLGSTNYGIAYTSAKIDFPEYYKLSKQVEEINKEFTNYDVTPSNLKSAKEARARLNKLSKELNSRKIAIVKVVDQPVDAFKGQIKDLLNKVGQASNHIGNQIKAYQDKERQDKEEQVRHYIDKWCQEAGVDPTRIEYNPKWLNKSEPFSPFENEVKNQINYLIEQQQQLAENVKVVTAKANELGLPYQHWVEQLNSVQLSDVLEQMVNYANQVKEAAERDKEAKKKAQANLVNKGNKLVDKKTGEVKGDYHTAILLTSKVKITLGGTQYQFNQLKKYLDDMGFKMKVERV